ncbi:hypothetical protein [Streptomyces sp. AP-93]|uniref:hypothetical protein n=1 Tax=Streptomyces sp. AP-93 TaxID=2929048 RepID=UPI001FB0457B|nr:hypothetical protein [Streptomyces sp. AP-93]MCJ0875252.1 hypothetical protein [Streptomyces sp. AP-93]
MNDNEQASPSPDASRHGLAGQSAGADYETALETVGQVITWYTERILAERRSDRPDEQLLEQMMSRRQACVDDQERLEDAGAEETARIAAAYDALLDELESAGP